MSLPPLFPRFFLFALMVAMVGCEPSGDEESAPPLETLSAPKVKGKRKGLAQEKKPSDLNKTDDPMSKESTSSTALNDSMKDSQKDDVKKEWVDPSQLPFESWEVHYLGNKGIGMSHRKASVVEIVGRKAVQMELETYLTRKAQGKTVHSIFKVRTTENFNGELRSIHIEQTENQLQTVTQGNIILNALHLTTRIATENAAEPTSARKIPWTPDLRGPFALEQSLRRLPMKQGDRRIISFLDPFQLQIVEKSLEANAIRRVPLLNGKTEKLLEVFADELNTNAKQKVNYWVGGDATIEKSFLEPTGMVTLRTTEPEAKRVKSQLELEQVKLGAIELKAVPPSAFQGKMVRYRVKLQDADPFSLFSKRCNQTVRSIQPLVSEVTVHAIEANSELPESIEKEGRPGPEYLSSNAMMQLEDPRVAALANLANGDSRDLNSLQRLSRQIQGTIKPTELIASFRTSAETVEDRQGSSADIAILFCAICRAQGVPSRIAIGFAPQVSESAKTDSSTSQSATPFKLVHHFWTEVWISGRWIPLDPIDSQNLFPSNRLKIRETSLEDGDLASPFLDAVRLREKLEVEVVAVP